MKKKTLIVNRRPEKLVKTYIMPHFKFSTVLFKSFNDLKKIEKKKKISYGTQGNPNSNELIKIISIIEKGNHVVLNQSGLMSIFLCYFSFLNYGDCVLIPDNLYFPNLSTIYKFKKKYNIKILIFNPIWNYKILCKKFSKYNIKIIFIELPGSITFEMPDIKSILKFSKKKKIISIVDNTFSAGIGFNPLKKGFDISIQAITKYYSGNNDVMMGAVITNNKKFYKILFNHNKYIGGYVDAFDCSLIIRSIPTLEYRYKIHEKKAIIVMNWLKKKKIIKKILNPYIKDSIGHKHWKKNFKNTSGLFSIIFKKKIKKKNIIKFINNLKIFSIGYSWGGAKSLVMLYENILKNRMNFKKIKNRYVIRFYIGLESLKDIKRDINNSLKLL
ncbi:PLP-dependent transferase [Candidatus Vidania fulgoroideorum]